MIGIKTLHFINYEELASALSDEYKEIKEKDDLDSVGVIAKYNDTKEIIVELIRLGYGIASISEFSDGCWNGYNEEYLISLLEDEVWCQPIKIGNSYLTIGNKLTYLLDDCNSKIISYIDSPVIYEVSVGDECNGDCDNCNCYDETYLNTSEDEDGNTHGFTASKSDGDSYMSYSYYSSDELSHEDIQKMLKAFGF